MIIFGAGKLPQIGTGIGQSIRNFKKGVAEVEAEIKRERSGTSIELLVNFCYET